MNCEQTRQTLLDSLDGPTTTELRLSMEGHIATCEACRGFAEIQRTIDARLTAATPVAFLCLGFRSSLQQKLNDGAVLRWPEFLPDVAHLAGCASAILLLLVVMPEYSRIVLLVGAGFTSITYFLQAVLRNSLEKVEHTP